MWLRVVPVLGSTLGELCFCWGDFMDLRRVDCCIVGAKYHVIHRTDGHPSRVFESAETARQEADRCGDPELAKELRASADKAQRLNAAR